MEPNKGRIRESGAGGVPAGVCVCPICGYRMERPPAVPCYTLHCLRCEAQMVPG